MNFTLKLCFLFAINDFYEEYLMKNNKKCPKCNSSAIGRKRGSPVLNSWSRISINLTSLDVWITRFVCTECGYIEEWIENPSDLKRFKAQE
jgi:ribosomal protein S27AE